jgi:alanyl-tRNA synthetase
LGVEEPFLHKVAQTVINESRAAYPELEEKKDYITRVIRTEEENFNRTIDAGLRILHDLIAQTEKAGKTVLAGADAFKLYDTYGFPIDLTIEILNERGMEVDRESFDKLMQEQRERARAATAALGDFGWAGVNLGLDKNLKTEFTGYGTLTEEGVRVLAIVSGEELRAAAYEGEEAVVVLDKTPF